MQKISICIIHIIIIIIINEKKFNVAFSPKELQGHGTHDKRRRVQYSTVLVESI